MAKSVTPSEFVPVRVAEIELGQPLSDLAAAEHHSTTANSRFMVMVRLHGIPLGIIEAETRDPVLPAGELAEIVQRELGEAIARHLREDHLPDAPPLTTAGLPVEGEPTCAKRRAGLLENPPLVSVIIATRNRTARLRTTLETVLAQAYPCFEVIVVDNAPSNDDTKALIEGQYGGSEKVKYVREERPGVSNAHNTGIPLAKGDILAFADDDLRVDREWLAAIVADFRAFDHVGCVTGMIVPDELAKPAQLWFDQYGRLNKGLSPQVFDLETNRRTNPLYPYAAGSYGSGANMAFSREALEAIGGFDPVMGTGTTAKGGDDLAAFFDVILAGYRLVYEPAALVWHSHPSEYAYLRKQAYCYGVGLVAYLMRILVRYPKHRLAMLSRFPHAAWHVLDPKSPKNSGRAPDYPAELDMYERLGMLAGPIAYFRSFMEVRALENGAGSSAKKAPGSGARAQ